MKSTRGKNQGQNCVTVAPTRSKLLAKTTLQQLLLGQIRSDSSTQSEKRCSRSTIFIHVYVLARRHPICMSVCFVYVGRDCGIEGGGHRGVVLGGGWNETNAVLTLQRRTGSGNRERETFSGNIFRRQRNVTMSLSGYLFNQTRSHPWKRDSGRF